MRTDESVERPLHDVRVIEFEAIGPGPLAGRMLSGVGAHVTVAARPTISRGGPLPVIAVRSASPIHLPRKTWTSDPNCCGHNGRPGGTLSTLLAAKKGW